MKLFTQDIDSFAQSVSDVVTRTTIGTRITIVTRLLFLHDEVRTRFDRSNSEGAATELQPVYKDLIPRPIIDVKRLAWVCGSVENVE